MVNVIFHFFARGYLLTRKTTLEQLYNYLPLRYSVDISKSSYHQKSENYAQQFIWLLHLSMKVEDKGRQL